MPVRKGEEPLQLSAAPNITQPQPGRTAISDAGLVHIAQMKNLEKLEQRSAAKEAARTLLKLHLSGRVPREILSGIDLDIRNLLEGFAYPRPDDGMVVR